jgi:hypothetical protein
MGWIKFSGKDGGPLELGAEGYQQYDEVERFGKSIIRIFINATPAQVMGVSVDGRADIDCVRHEET